MKLLQLLFNIVPEGAATITAPPSELSAPVDDTWKLTRYCTPVAPPARLDAAVETPDTERGPAVTV